MYLQKVLVIEIVVELDPSNEIKNWNDAMDRANDLNMRLPSRTESMIIVDAIQRGDLDPKAFPDKWWTSEEYTNVNAWSVVHDGTTKQDYKYDETGVVYIRDMVPPKNPAEPPRDKEISNAKYMVTKLRDMGYEVTCTKTETITL